MHIPRPEAGVATHTRQRSLRTRVGRSAIVGLLVILWIAPIVLTASWISLRAFHTRASATRASAPDATDTSDIASAIAHQSQTTPAQYDFTAPTTVAGSSDGTLLDGVFALYYAAHDGRALLGVPLAPAYPIAGGWAQFFVSGALIVPTQPASTAGGAASFAGLAQPVLAGGVRDNVTGIIRLPLVQPLLRAGSLVAVAGPGTPTYASLRREVMPISLTPIHSASAQPASAAGDAGEPSFTYRQADQSYSGRIIPQPIWQFMNRPDIAPDGWQTDIGLPLTPPVTMTVNERDGGHQLQVECFYRAALVEDDGVQGMGGTPLVSSLSTGLAYAQTLGVPAASTSTASQAWVSGDTALLDAPGAGRPLAQLGLNVPVTLSGETIWIGDDLWYAVRWVNLHAQGGGWLSADSLAFSPPGAGTSAWSSFDLLSPDLASYLRSLGGDTGAVVYDESRQRYYTDNMNSQFTVASSMKVPIMLAFLTMTERQGREPNGDELYLLQTMIENSDNDSAQALFLEIRGLGPIQTMLQQLGISSFTPNYDFWGWSTLSPLAMVRLLTALHDGKALTAQDRALALGLMAQIEPDQQTGVGSTAPQGASYWMKDGWVPGPDGLWAMNSSGIVTLGGETYIIAVYSQDKVSLDDGWTIAKHVCGAVGHLLTSS